MLGTGLTSLASDWSHEMATAVLPGLLVTLGAGPGWLGAIEGAADGLSSFTKLAAGHWTDRLHRRKPLVVSAYALTAAATGALAFATSAMHIMAARCTAWLGRGLRTPGRKALLAAAVPPSAYGRAFGFERMMDTLGAIVAPVDGAVAARRHGPQLPARVSVDAGAGRPGGRALRRPGARARIRGASAFGDVICHQPASFAFAISPLSAGRRHFRAGRFFAHAADSLCQPGADALDGICRGVQRGHRPVSPAQRFLRRLRVPRADG